MSYDAIIFDVDGVLVDVSNSFTAAAVDAIVAATGSRRFTSEEAGQLKVIRGFNNDWHVAVAGGAWVSFYGDLPFSDYAQGIEREGGGLKGLRHLIGSNLTAEFEARLTRLAQEAYGGTTACKLLYGFEPETIRQPGRWREEVPMLSATEASFLVPMMGIVSGRSATEMELAFEVLGWRLPLERVAVSDDPELDKPNPAKLAGILDYIGSNRALLVGDGRDDLELAENARESSGREVDFCFIGAHPAPWPEVNYNFQSVREMLNQIEVDYDKSQTG